MLEGNDILVGFEIDTHVCDFEDEHIMFLQAYMGTCGLCDMHERNLVKDYNVTIMGYYKSQTYVRKNNINPLKTKFVQELAYMKLHQSKCDESKIIKT